MTEDNFNKGIKKGTFKHPKSYITPTDLDNILTLHCQNTQTVGHTTLNTKPNFALTIITTQDTEQKHIYIHTNDKAIWYMPVADNLPTVLKIRKLK